MLANNNVALEKLQNFIRVPVVSSEGETLDEIVYRNTIFPVYHEVSQPRDMKIVCHDYPIIVVQWGWTGDPDGKLSVVTSDELKDTLEWGGNTYLINKYAGTQVKDQRTLGVRADVVPFFNRWIKVASDATRIQRAALPMGSGMWRADSLKVVYAKDGMVLGEPDGTYAPDGRLVIEDGAIYVADDLVSNYEGPEVLYKYSKQHSQVWQDLQLTPALEKAIKDVVAGYYKVTGTKRDVSYEIAEHMEMYQTLRDLNPLMERHPLLTRKVASGHRDWFLERYQSVPVLMRAGIAAPIPRDIAYLPETLETGYYACHRYPKVSPANTYVHNVKEITAKMRDWHAWLKSRWGFQCSIVNNREFWKGVVITVPRRLMPFGADIVTSASNVKLGPNRKDTIERRLKNSDYYVYIMEDVYIVATQAYKKGSFAGINMKKYMEDGVTVDPSTGPAQSFDCDGDIKNEMKVLKEIAVAFMKSQVEGVLSLKVPKLPKSKKFVPNFLVNAFLGGRLIGQWTNLRAWYLALPNSRRKYVQNKLYEGNYFDDETGQVPNEPTHRAALVFFALRIQEAVDSPKTMDVDMFERLGDSNKVQAILSTAGVDGSYLKSPGFVHWKRSAGAGSKYLPSFVSDLPDWMRMRAEIDVEFRTSEGQWIDSTPDIMEDSIIGFIMRTNEPYLREIWSSSVKVEEHLPLSEYTGWAGVMDREIVQYFESVFFPAWAKHRARLRKEQSMGLYDITDPEQVFRKAQTWAAEAAALVEQYFDGDRWKAARAGWIACHGTHRGKSTAALVFNGFWAECLKIIEGADKVHREFTKTLVIGLKHHFAGTPPKEFTCTVEIVNRTDHSGRKAVVAKTPVHNLLRDNGNGYPDFCIGAVQKIERPHLRAGYVVPELGTYEGHFKRVEGTSSWSVNLVVAED